MKKKARCFFDKRRICLDPEKGNCGSCKIGKKLGVERVTVTFKVE